MLRKLVGSRKDSIGLQQVLFNQRVPWLIEDLCPYEVGMISTLAHTDEEFRKRLKSYLGSFRSASYTGSTTSSEALLKTHFNINSTVTQVRWSLQSRNWDLLHAISSWVTPSMLEPITKLGNDIDKDDLLRSAADVGNYDVCRLLLDAGATIDFTLCQFMARSALNDEDFYRIVDLLLKYETNHIEKSSLSMTLLAVLRSGQLRSVHPEAIGVCLDRHMIDERRLYGNNDMSIGDSYVFWAIQNDWPAALSFFLDQCIPANALLGEIFPVQCLAHTGYFYPEALSNFTWLTMAVDLGMPASVDILVKHGGDIFLADGCGRTPLGLSRMHAGGSHPRTGSAGVHDFVTRPRHLWRGITVEQDAEVLNILESAAAKLSLDEDVTSNLSEDPICMASTEFVSGKEASRVIRWFRKIPHFQGLEWYLKNLWYEVHRHSKLPFREALLVRLSYVVSYLLLFLVEAVVLVSHLRVLPQLPKSTLCAGLLLLLALAWSLKPEG